MNDTTITITSSTLDRFSYYKENRWSDDHFLNKLMDFVDCFSECWNDFKTDKLVFQNLMKYYTKVWVSIDTAKKLEELRKPGELINAIIRYLIYHKWSCIDRHVYRKWHGLYVRNKTRVRIKRLKPPEWTEDRFLSALLDRIELNKGLQDWSQ